jgi:hypothetical protein
MSVGSGERFDGICPVGGQNTGSGILLEVTYGWKGGIIS